MSTVDVFKNFIATNEILVVDKNPSSRVRLQKLMIDLGAKTHMVHSVKSIAESTQLLDERKIGLVMCDYFIEGGSGFDLFKSMRESKPALSREACFILVTSNFSQAAVAKAAEEDVDSYVIKPYTIQSIQENLMSTILAKIKPSDYIVKIEAGKVCMSAGQYDQALKTFNHALKLHPKPALALFYIGQTEYLKSRANSEDIYAEGLSFNSIHYKCLIGLYDAFMRMEKIAEAYQVLKKIVDYFPAHPERLTQIVRLAIKTNNFKDMDSYYKIFTSLEERTPVLINYIGAGLYIAGKHHLMNRQVDEALKNFDNLAVSCSEFTKFIRAIISLLVEYKKADLAEKYLKRFPAGSDQQEDYLVSHYLVSSRISKDNSYLVKTGLDIYNRKIRDYQFLQAMLQAMQQAGLKEERMRPIQVELQTLYPDKVSV